MILLISRLNLNPTQLAAFIADELCELAALIQDAAASEGTQTRHQGQDCSVSRGTRQRDGLF